MFHGVVDEPWELNASKAHQGSRRIPTKLYNIRCITRCATALGKCYFVAWLPSGNESSRPDRPLKKRLCNPRVERGLRTKGSGGGGGFKILESRGNGGRGFDPLAFYEIVFSNNNRKHGLQTWINRGQRNFTGLHFKLGLNFELHLMAMEWSRNNNTENSPVGEVGESIGTLHVHLIVIFSPD